jgi:hypothetical protein
VKSCFSLMMFMAQRHKPVVVAQSRAFSNVVELDSSVASTVPLAY